MATTTNDSLPRAAYSFSEVARMLGKDRTWVYRQVAAGKLRAVTGIGIAMIPAAELERILAPQGKEAGQ